MHRARSGPSAGENGRPTRDNEVRRQRRHLPSITSGRRSQLGEPLRKFLLLEEAELCADLESADRKAAHCSSIARGPFHVPSLFPPPDQAFRFDRSGERITALVSEERPLVVVKRYSVESFLGTAALDLEAAELRPRETRLLPRAVFRLFR